MATPLTVQYGWGELSHSLTLDEELETIRWLLREEVLFSRDETPEKLSDPKQSSRTCMHMSTVNGLSRWYSYTYK